MHILKTDLHQTPEGIAKGFSDMIHLGFFKEIESSGRYTTDRNKQLVWDNEPGKWVDVERDRLGDLEGSW